MTYDPSGVTYQVLWHHELEEQGGHSLQLSQPNLSVQAVSSLSLIFFHRLFLIFLFLTSAPFVLFFIYSFFGLFCFSSFGFLFCLVWAVVMSSGTLSFHSLVPTNLSLCFFSSPPRFPHTSVSLPLRDLLLLGRSRSCVLYFILSFSFSPYYTWKGSGTWNTSQEYRGVQSVNIWDNVTPMALGSDQC